LARANCGSLLAAARAYTSRGAIFSRHARALFRPECCNQRIAFVCMIDQPSGFLRMPHSRPLMVLRSNVPKALATASGASRISAWRTLSIASNAIATTWKRS
jgi:hypothetical protein